MRRYFLGGEPSSPVAIFSPNGKQFLIRMKRGNVERNVVEYSLLLFQTSEAFRSPVGKTLVTMSSSSNREAIQQVRWLDDRTLTFLGENPGDIPQVYRFGVFTKRLTRITHHANAIVSYDISRDGSEIVYEAVPRPKNLLETEQVQRRGWVVTSQYVDDLLPGSVKERDDPRADRELFVQVGHENAVRMPSPDFWANICLCSCHRTGGSLCSPFTLAIFRTSGKNMRMRFFVPTSWKSASQAHSRTSSNTCFLMYGARRSTPPRHHQGGGWTEGANWSATGDPS